MAAVCSHGENPLRTRECLIQTNDSSKKFREEKKKNGKTAHAFTILLSEPATRHQRDYD